MLLDLRHLVGKYRMQIRGVLHVGAHEAEEYEVYRDLGVPRVLWVEANPGLATKLQRRFNDDPTQLVLNRAVNRTGHSATLNLANNGQSSSLLPLGTHREHHPEVHYVGELQVPGVTLNQLAGGLQASAARSGLANLNFWNLDIQGLEYDALAAADRAVSVADWIYTEINAEEVYVGARTVVELDELLGDFGFERLETVMTPHQWGDALYGRKT